MFLSHKSKLEKIKNKFSEYSIFVNRLYKNKQQVRCVENDRDR